MLGRTLVFLLGAILVVGGLTAIAASNVTFLYDHPLAPEARIIVDSKGARIDLDAIKQQVAKETGVAGLPRAAVPTTDYDFGLMDPMTTGTYDFEIKNVGDAPLHLKLGPTSCKCTISGLSADKLEGFASRHGPRFYGLPVNADTVTLVETTWTAPVDIPFGADRLVPLRAGTGIAWKLA